MRLLASFLCTFLLLLFCGTLAYIYILWRHYWLRVEKLARDQDTLPRLGGYHGRYRGVARLGYDEATESFLLNDGHGLGPQTPDQESAFEKLSRLRSNRGHPHSKAGRKKAAEEKKEIPLLKDSIPKDKLLGHVMHYEEQIVNQLLNAVLDTGKSVRLGEIKNSYHVKYSLKSTQDLVELQPINHTREDVEKLICSLKGQVQIKTFLRDSAPFFKSQQLDSYFVEEPLLDGNTFDTCGVVSSSGSLVNAQLGKEIDDNEFVIRFNNAPTKGFERDVGSKTSLRIVNSQVVGKPQFKFLEGSQELYSQSPVLVWDPSGYNASLGDWYANPDYPFFETFFSKRLMRPEQALHLLRPGSLWTLWDWLQSHNKYPLLPNPPSSGFLGLVLAITRCRQVHVYEYVPSMRLTKRCHYYDDEENLGCTIGDWHPLAAEKLMALAVNVGNKTEVFADGYLTVPGLPSLGC